jgi:hypothetical protein
MYITQQNPGEEPAEVLGNGEKLDAISRLQKGEQIVDTPQC